MIEFKFPCPSCGQNIQATDAYSGHQINCPSCQSPFVVPQAPGAPPPVPAAAARSAAPARPQQTAHVSQRQPVAGKKPTNKWILIGAGTASFLVAGVVTFFLVTGGFSHSDSTSTDASGKSAATRSNSSSKDSASANLEGPSAAEIIQKVTDQYASFTSYSAKRSAFTDMDLSKVDVNSIPGASASKKNSKQLQQSMPKRVKAESEFTVKLGRPDFYRVEWDTKNDAANNMTMKGAAWSAGEGDFISMNKMKYAKFDSREMALASATGVSGGVAGTVPGIFFNDQTSALTYFSTAKRKPDESADGEDCYVLDGNAMGMKVVLWVTKDKYLIKQKQIVFGGNSKTPAITDAQIDEQLKKMPNLSAKEKADAKKGMKDMKPMLSSMKGTMTETYRDIEINKTVAKGDFKYQMPAGATLSKSLF